MDGFLKIVTETNSLNVSVLYEIYTIHIFFSSLLASYDQLKHILKYGNESLSLEEVISIAMYRERELAENYKREKSVWTTLITVG